MALKTRAVPKTMKSLPISWLPLGQLLGRTSSTQARIIAINEGRLRDFLDHSPLRQEFEGLRRAVQEFS
jgi:hypothetical protein